MPSTGNYEMDDTPYLVGFIKANEKRYRDDQNIEMPEDKTDHAAISLLSAVAGLTSDVCESNGFYYAVGWAVHKELQKICCSICSDFFYVA